MIFLLNNCVLYSQIEPVTGLKYIDNGTFDSIFRRHSSDFIPSTYFCVTFDPTLSSLTLAGEVIKAYKEIRIFSRYTPIYFVYLNSGVVSNEPGDEDRYFNEIFFIDRVKDKNVHFIQNDLLYDSLNINTLMTKWFYVYQNKLIAGATSVKLHSLSDYSFILPKDIIELGVPTKTKIHLEKMRLSTKRDVIRPYLPNKLLYITDMNNSLHLLNTVTTKFEKTVDKTTFDFVDFYCKNISKNESDCQLASMNNDNQFNRDPLFYAGVYFNNNNIYVSTGLEINVPWESSLYSSLKYMTYINEIGEKEKVKYDIIGETYPAVLKFDTSFNFIQAYHINISSYPVANRIPQKAGFWGASDKGFIILDSILIMDNNPDASIPLKKIPKRANHAFSIFKLGDNNTFSFDKFLPIPYYKEYIKYMNWHSRTYYFKLKEFIYGNMLNGGYINKLNSNYSTYRLKGLSDKLIEETIPNFSEDTTWFKVNFRTLCINSIFDEEYAIVIYYFQDQPMLELLEYDPQNGDLSTVQVTSLSSIEGFKTLEYNTRIPHNGDGLCISNNSIYMTRLEMGEYFLYKYPIILKRKLKK